MGVIYRYCLAHHVPLHGSATFADISKKCCLSEDLVERVLRQAMTNLMFTELPPGYVKHSAMSRLLVTDPDLHDTIGLIAFDLAPLREKTLEAMAIYPDSFEPDETAFSLQNQPGVSMFSYLSKYPAREKRFGNAMRCYSRVEEWDLKHLVRTYPWESIDRPGSIFVDIGGGQGTVSSKIVSIATHIEFIVQDLGSVVQEGEAILPTELKDRVKFMEHDFFTEQPIKNADVYFFRWILIHWSDKYCLQILRQLIPALKDGAKVIVYEAVLIDEPETQWTEKQSRYVQ